jgi:hypothetical protein
MYTIMQEMKSIEALLRFPSSSTMQRMLQTSLIQLLTHADAAAADWQQLQASAVHSHINASSALQLITGVPSAVLLLLDPMQQQALLGIITTLMQRGLLQHLTPLISTCATPHVVTLMVAQMESFTTMLDKGSSCGELLLNVLVEQALSHVQWLLAYGEAGAGHYVRLCWQLLTTTSPADLRNQAQAVCQESNHRQQQEAAAAAGNSAGCSQSSSSAYCTTSAAASAAATAAASAEEMADAVPQPDTPGLYKSSSNSVLGCEPDMAWPGCSDSSMLAAAESAFGGGQCSLYSEQPDLTFSSSSSSSNAAAFGWSNQYDSSSNTWEQMQGRSLYGGAAGDSASPGVFGSSGSSSSSSSSNTAAAAFAGDESVPDTFNNSSSSLIYSSSPAARLSWGSQDDSGSTEQPSSSNSWQQYQGLLFGDAADDSGAPAAGMSQYGSLNVYESSSTTAAAVGDAVELGASSMLPASTAVDNAVPTSSISSSSSAEFVGADSSMAAASAAVAAVEVEIVEVSGGSSSSSSGSGRPGRAKVLRCLAVCAVVAVRIVKGCGARGSAAS